jgi:hypothetical protein
MSLEHVPDYNDKLALVQGMTFMGQPVAEMDKQDLLYVVMSLDLMRQHAADQLRGARQTSHEIMTDLANLRLAGLRTRDHNSTGLPG